jgi:TonB family protein
VSRKHKHIEQLSPALIRAYREGSLSAEEMYAVEKYLLENPFEAAAIEGLETLAPEKLDAHMQDLHARLEKRLASDDVTPVVFWTLTRKIAASLLVLLTAGFLYFYQQPEITTRELTVKTEEKNKQQERQELTGRARAAASPDSASTDSDTKPEPAPPAEPKRKPDISVVHDAINPNLSAENEEVADEENGLPNPTEIQSAKEKNLFADAVETAERKANARLALDIKSERSDSLLADLPPPSLMNTIVDIASIDTPFTYRSIPERSSESDSSININLPSVDSIKTRLRAGYFAANTPITKQEKSIAAKSISGRVTDATDGTPLPQVTVLVKGTTIGITTDQDGRYTLTSEDSIKTLIFRYLGYSGREVVVNGKTEINIALNPDTQALGEVVVTGFGIAEEKEEEVKEYNPARPAYGRRAFTQHLKENLVYPDKARKKKIKGAVLLEFIVTAEGKIEDIKVLKGLGYGCDEEAIRLVKTGPVWRPRKTGIDSDTPVDSKVRVRIRFKP